MQSQERQNGANHDDETDEIDDSVHCSAPQRCLSLPQLQTPWPPKRSVAPIADFSRMKERIAALPLLNPELFGGREIDAGLAPDRECDDDDCIFDLSLHGVADVRDLARIRGRIRNIASPEAAKRGISRAARSLSRIGCRLPYR
ncbi:hypothetical protein FHR88_003781 [Bradyrhizobium betae]|nr:hypothetical protein [Bradyrhizobium betae]